MQNNWYFLLGYVRFYIEQEKLKKCIELLRRENVNAHFHPDGTVDVSIFHYKKAKRILKDDIVFIEQGVGGVYSVFCRMKSHIAILASIVCMLLLYLFLYQFVFDIRIEGNDYLTSEQVCEELSDAGLYIGARWGKISFSEVEGSVLVNSETISWLTIYRRGMVAYVTIKEKEAISQKQTFEGYANIVSRFDGVIEEISVKSGSSAVRVGDTVKKGELLISSFDSGGKPTYAQGEIYGRVYTTISIFIPNKAN